MWQQWKTPRRRRAALLALGVRPRLASNIAGSGLGPWHLARAKALSVGLSNAYFKSLGLPTLIDEVRVYPTRTAVYGPVCTVVGQGAVGDRRPYADQVAQRLLIARTWVTASWRKTGYRQSGRLMNSHLRNTDNSSTGISDE
jgi:hypothetical protein